MPDPVERLVNLALLLAGSPAPLSADEIRAQGIGYPESQDAAAFFRMFERDKEDLRRAGLAIQVVDPEGQEAYRLDPAQTYAPEIDLSAGEVATLHAAAAALAGDESFPFGSDLRIALAKVLAEIDEPDAAAAGRGRMADERPAAQGALAALLSTAVAARKRVAFDYETYAGGRAAREVEPYGLFLREGRWYLVGRDLDRDALRTFALARTTGLTANSERPKTPDFERPADFDVASFVTLPFQYGGRDAPFDATVRFEPAHAWRAERLTARVGSLSPQPDGAVLWRVRAADERALARWVVENGPGVELLEPAAARETLLGGLEEVARLHGR